MSFVSQFHEEWTPGFITDGVLLLFVNRIVRRNERKRVVGQIGSLSNEFALDAVRLARDEGWLQNGALVGMEYERAKLVDADFHGADLRGVNFSFADLRRANFTHAKLEGADFSGANLSDADLRWANLNRADLSWSNLRYAQLEGASLTSIDTRCAAVDKSLKNDPQFTNAVVGGHLSDNQIRLVRESFALVEQAGEPAIEHFYERLFDSLPEVKPLFPDNSERQARKFLQSLRMVVGSLDTPEKNISILQRLGERHVRYGVQADHYQKVGAVLIETLQQLLGSHFTEEVRDAWSSAYNLIASVMQYSAADAS